MRDGCRCRECGVVPLIVSHTTTKLPAHVGDTVEFSCTTPRAIYTSSMVKPRISRRMPRARLCCARLSGPRARPRCARRFAYGCPTPGRFDVLGTDPLKLIDACHNPPELRELCERTGRDRSVRRESSNAAVRGVADKDVAGIVDVLVPAFPVWS
mgnify:CR=1 FL=1